MMTENKQANKDYNNVSGNTYDFQMNQNKPLRSIIFLYMYSQLNQHPAGEL